MKRLISIICIAAMLATLILPIGATPRNGANTRPVRITDALDIVRAVVGFCSNARFPAHDFNHNWRFDIQDALLAVRSVVGIGERQTIAIPTRCSGCGDRRFPWAFSPRDVFEDNAVVVVLTGCVSRADNRDWTLEDFGNISGALYIEDMSRLSDEQWELIQDGRWQETFVNWPEFRRSMLIRLEQNCRENLFNVMNQLQQLEFIIIVEPNYIPIPY